MRDLLVAFRGRWRAQQSAYPRFVGSAAAVGCGPIVAGEPLTPRLEAYVRELEAFEASGVLPAWEQPRAVLEAERLDLHAVRCPRRRDAEAGSAADQEHCDQPMRVGVRAGPSPARVAPARGSARWGSSVNSIAVAGNEASQRWARTVWRNALSCPIWSP